jgi:hypothetical protein
MTNHQPVQQVLVKAASRGWVKSELAADSCPFFPPRLTAGRYSAGEDLGGQRCLRGPGGGAWKRAICGY